MKIKVKNLLISFGIALVMCALCILPNMFVKSNEVATRTIDVSEIGTLSYEDKVNNLLQEFDKYSYDYNEQEIFFSGTSTNTIEDLYNITFLSTPNEEDVIEYYKTRFNPELQTFIVTIKYLQGDIVLKEMQEQTTPIYDEKANDYYIILSGGDKISVKETLIDDNFNSCIALVDDAAIALILVAALAITLVVSAPDISTTVTTVVTTVVSWVRSFWSWFCSIWTPKTTTVTQTIVTTIATPTLTIDKTTYKTKTVTLTEVQNEKKYPAGQYYLCFVDGSNIYMSIASISKEMAVSILMTGVKEKSPSNNREMIASTYTRMRNDAYIVAYAAGLNIRTPYEKPDYDHGTYHYHSAIEIVVNGQKDSPHSFYCIG